MLRYNCSAVNRNICLADIVIKSILHRLTHPDYKLRFVSIKFLLSLSFLDLFGINTRLVEKGILDKIH